MTRSANKMEEKVYFQYGTGSLMVKKSNKMTHWFSFIGALTKAIFLEERKKLTEVLNQSN
jgi:hypothetical protein